MVELPYRKLFQGVGGCFSGLFILFVHPSLSNEVDTSHQCWMQRARLERMPGFGLIQQRQDGVDACKVETECIFIGAKMRFTLSRVDLTIRRHMICGRKYLGKSAIVIHSPYLCRCQMGFVVLAHGGFLKKERLKLGGAANIAICG